MHLAVLINFIMLLVKTRRAVQPTEWALSILRNHSSMIKASLSTHSNSYMTVRKEEEKEDSNEAFSLVKQVELQVKTIQDVMMMKVMGSSKEIAGWIPKASNVNWHPLSKKEIDPYCSLVPRLRRYLPCHMSAPSSISIQSHTSQGWRPTIDYHWTPSLVGEGRGIPSLRKPRYVLITIVPNNSHSSWNLLPRD